VIIKEVRSAFLDYSSSEVEDHRGGGQQEGKRRRTKEKVITDNSYLFRIMGKY
jgi:hypothetical protein